MQSTTAYKIRREIAMLVYCDSVILIYYFDHSGPMNARARNGLAAIAAVGGRIAISDLVRLEYRVHPLKHTDVAKLALFDAFCSRPDIGIVPISTRTFDRATEIRAYYGFKLGDSLHLAAAIESGCDQFLTNDTRLATFVGLPIVVLP